MQNYLELMLSVLNTHLDCCECLQPLPAENKPVFVGG